MALDAVGEPDGVYEAIAAALKTPSPSCQSPRS
jgi:hypothetical protein